MNARMNWVTFKENGCKFCILVIYCADILDLCEYQVIIEATVLLFVI